MPTKRVWASSAKAARNKAKRSLDRRRVVTRVKRIKNAGSKGRKHGGPRRKLYRVTFKWKRGYSKRSPYADKRKYTGRDRATRSRSQRYERRRRKG